MVNKLSHDKQREILHLMVEGNSIRGIARLTDTSPVTVLRHLELAGSACAEYHNEKVRGLKSRRIECDEIWSFNYCKKKNLNTAKAAPEGAGDCWTWTAIDPESKLLVSFMSGGRDVETATLFMTYVASRLSSRVQLTSDGFGPYLEAVEGSFGLDVDFAQLVKQYGTTETDRRTQYVGADREARIGQPDKRFVSTSAVEKHNQTMRQHMRRFARKTAGHSKKFLNHVCMTSLYAVWYNFARINSAVKSSPAMAAGLTGTLLEMDDLVDLINGSTS